MYNNELYHHGIIGQRWGKRNGPPYPLSRSTAQKVSSRKNRGILGYLAERKAKKEAEKRAKAEKEELAKKKSEEEAKARHDADKERVLREGSASEVLQYKGEISNQELNNALNRIRWTNELSKMAANEVQDGWKVMEDVMKKVGNIKDWTKTGLELWEAIEKAKTLADKQRQRQ